MNMIEQRDPLAKQAIINSASYYGIGVANMVNLLHPEVVVLSGPLIYDYADYFDEVVNTALKNVYYSVREHIRFTQGTLKSDAVAVGAAILIFQSYFKYNKKE